MKAGQKLRMLLPHPQGTIRGKVRYIGEGAKQGFSKVHILACSEKSLIGRDIDVINGALIEEVVA